MKASFRRKNNMPRMTNRTVQKVTGYVDIRRNIWCRTAGGVSAVVWLRVGIGSESLRGILASASTAFFFGVIISELCGVSNRTASWSSSSSERKQLLCIENDDDAERMRDTVGHSMRVGGSEYGLHLI
jgi:hypothetical protein